MQTELYKTHTWPYEHLDPVPYIFLQLKFNSLTLPKKNSILWQEGRPPLVRFKNAWRVLTAPVVAESQLGRKLLHLPAPYGVGSWWRQQGHTTFMHAHEAGHFFSCLLSLSSALCLDFSSLSGHTKGDQLVICRYSWWHRGFAMHGCGLCKFMSRFPI